MLLKRPIIACVTLVASLPLVFSGTASGLVRAWDGTTAYNYCFLILPICFYLVWERRGGLLAAAPSPSILGMVALLGAGIVWLLGELSGTLIVSEFALVAMAQSMVVAILGIRAARTLIFPLFYLLFLVPIGESLIPPLQTFTAEMTVTLLKITGVPVHSDGLMIYVANARWVVAEACAGVKFLIASLALGALLSAMFLRTWRRRALFLGLSAIVPVLANGVRAYIIVLVGYLTNNATAAYADHILYGWVLFAIVLLAMVAIAVALREPDAEPSRPAWSILSGERLGAAKPSPWISAAALSSLLIVVSVKAGAASLSVVPADIRIPTALPLSIGGGWTPIAKKDPTPPVFFGADRVWDQAYSNGSATVYLTVGYFAFERPGAEIASSQHRFGRLDPSKTEQSYQQIGAEDQRIDVKALTFQAPGEQRLLWHWLWVDGRFTGNPYVAKLLQLKAKLLGGPSAAAIICISADSGNKDTAAAALRGFAKNLSGLGN